MHIRAFKESIETPTNLTNLTNWTNLDFDDSENFANLMICLCYKQGYLLDQLLRSKQEKFIKEGGFRENLFLARRQALREAYSNRIAKPNGKLGGKKRQEFKAKSNKV